MQQTGTDSSQATQHASLLSRSFSLSFSRQLGFRPLKCWQRRRPKPNLLWETITQMQQSSDPLDSASNPRETGQGEERATGREERSVSWAEPPSAVRASVGNGSFPPDVAARKLPVHQLCRGESQPSPPGPRPPRLPSCVMRLSNAAP